jgi:proteic killer suppression protein
LAPRSAWYQPSTQDPQPVLAAHEAGGEVVHGHLDVPKLVVYASAVVQTFADRETKRFYTTGRSRRLPAELRRRASMRLLQLNAATRVEDLRLPPSNRLEPLHGDRAGQWSVRINDQWRLCFRFERGDAFDVEITDYH